MTKRLAALTNRPIQDRQRHGLFVLAAGLIVCAGALLLALPAGLQAPRPLGGPPPPVPAASAAAPAPRFDASNEVEAATRRFLRDYLRLLYGRGRAPSIAGSTEELRDRLTATRLRVPPAARRRDPRIVDIDLESMRGRRVAARAEIDDGGPARYRIQLTLMRRGGRWLVAEVADH